MKPVAIASRSGSKEGAVKCTAYVYPDSLEMITTIAGDRAKIGPVMLQVLDEYVAYLERGGKVRRNLAALGTPRPQLPALWLPRELHRRIYAFIEHGVPPDANRFRSLGEVCRAAAKWWVDNGRSHDVLSRSEFALYLWKSGASFKEVAKRLDHLRTPGQPVKVTAVRALIRRELVAQLGPVEGKAEYVRIQRVQRALRHQAKAAKTALVRSYSRPHGVAAKAIVEALASGEWLTRAEILERTTGAEVGATAIRAALRGMVIAGDVMSVRVLPGTGRKDVEKFGLNKAEGE